MLHGEQETLSSKGNCYSGEADVSMQAFPRVLTYFLCSQSNAVNQYTLFGD